MTEPLVHNSTSKKQIKDAERKIKYARQRAIDDMKKVIDLPEGRRVISRLLADFKIGQLAWKPGAEINRDVAKYECANHILSQVVKADPVIAAKMLTDAYVEALSE